MSERKLVSSERIINAKADIIFDLLADPAKHHIFDGSDTVQAANLDAPDRLSLGAKFGMKMRFGVPYTITNEVIEFEEGRSIAWRHFGHHVWRYELEPTDGGETRVTESFEWGDARFPPLYEWARYPAKHQRNIEATLEKLATVVESG